MTEQRRYLRMNTVFPVEFEILLGDGQKIGNGLLQGFTRDVSEGGMCIEFKAFGRPHEEALQQSDLNLNLTINPTFSVHPIKAIATVVWVQKEISASHSRYLIGITYVQIEERLRRRIIRHARRARLAPRLAGLGAALLLLALALLWTHDQSLIDENRLLINRLQEGAQKRSEVAQDLDGLGEKKRRLDSDLGIAKTEIEKMKRLLATMKNENEVLNEQSAALSTEYMKQREGYEAQLASRIAEEEKIQNELEGLRTGEKDLQETYQRLKEESQGSVAAVQEKMFEWLHSHQNRRTGLVASFEGDPSLEDSAFTYDQSLAVQVFLIAGRTSQAEDILSFFEKRAQRSEGVFYNGYDAVGGNAIESIVHVGPNVWLGIAALQYENRVKDGRFLPIARSIADWLMDFQDSEGGLRGGPDLTWYSTEHNLDAYAFFGMMKTMTGENRYGKAQQRSLEWLQKYAYSNKENRLNRGKGDSTIATDTFGWAVSAIGPEKLMAIEFDPEGIMDFAEKNCKVTVDFREASGKNIRVTGFDFAKAQNLGRGGVISAEWTSQMVVGFQVLARHFRVLGDAEKASTYQEKADFYMTELQKMLITSPSRTGQGRGCLPYASEDNIDTGHGWRTPKGASTGSVAATSYGIFAWKGYNPFELDGGEGLNAAS